MGILNVFFAFLIIRKLLKKMLEEEEDRATRELHRAIYNRGWNECRKYFLSGDWKIVRKED